NAVAREGELAGEVPVRVLINHAAHVVGIIAGEYAVHHHLGDRYLAAHRFAARLEIDGIGETLLRLGARLVHKAEPLGPTLRPPPVAGDLALAGDGDALAGAALAGARIERRALGV